VGWAARTLRASIYAESATSIDLGIGRLRLPPALRCAA